MAYLSSENLLDYIEILENDDRDILMSFLDEPQMEYCDDEKLKSLIQCLEADIEYPNITCSHNSTYPNLDGYEGDYIFVDDNSSSKFYNYEDNVYTRFASEDGEDSSEELVDVDDFSWMDMEMSFSTSPSNNNMIEFQNFITCIPIEEEVYDSLWLQTDLSMVDNY
ncbi:uncharacterized protein LOC129891836 [Solanum dulcamara]|uniref:uncharacterized protein LOC129891836 n=1 Tax=Solanum dulcamara TaxID=45834 RepID=UPI0024859C34|nr:uncharacterized protein LOC129891836 [Solanum dulcamara]